MNKYQLVEKADRNLENFKVTIVADSNDGDYMTEVTYYSKEVFEEYVIDGLIDLKNNYSGEHELSKCPNEYELDIPYNGWDGYCHTLKELIVEYIDKNGKVWDVQF